MMPFHQSDIIRDASTARQSNRKVMDGVIHSGVLNTFQTGGVDGLVQSGMPEHRRSAAHHKEGGKPKPILHKSKKSATPVSPGFLHYPGSNF
jgi:hypothetical protein